MQKLLTGLLLLASSILYSQGFELKDFRFGELEMNASRERIIQVMGKPLREYEPHYECGFFSEAVQGVKYWELDYGFVSFIGNSEECYTVHNIDFTKKTSAVVYYKGQKLTSESRLADLIRILGASNTQEFIIRLQDSDAALLFTTQNGKLVSFHYWTPC